MKSMIFDLFAILALYGGVHCLSAVDTEEYCMLETFQPRCLRNEAILMNSATYGRMRIGRCIKQEEVTNFGDGPRYFRCSADVLPIVDRRCSGKSECDVRLLDIANENVKPCVQGLTVYLEVSYACVQVVDEGHSCSVAATNAQTHIKAPTGGTQGNCGTKLQPWIIEAPIGQKIKISLIDFLGSGNQSESNRHSCVSYGMIVDKPGKRNVPICGGGRHRTKLQHLSIENALEIYFNSEDRRKTPDNVTEFFLRIEAVGCSDLIPPENAWLKRIEDEIVIGCYSSRRTWHLRCEEETWIGVFGNCSQADYAVEEIDDGPEMSESNNHQVLIMIAIGGFALAVCLVLLLTTIIYLRRFSAKKKKTKDYKTLSFVQGTKIPHCNQFGMDSSVGSNEPRRFIDQQQMPTYSVYLGEGDFNDTNRPALVSNSAHSLARE